MDLQKIKKELFRHSKGTYSLNGKTYKKWLCITCNKYYTAPVKYTHPTSKTHLYNLKTLKNGL